MPPGEGFRPSRVQGVVEIVEHGMGITPVIHQPVDPLTGTRSREWSGNTAGDLDDGLRLKGENH
jgi:hypothetical protein